MDAYAKAKQIMELAPVDWEATFENIGEPGRDALRREFEAIAERAAMLARYADQRAGGGMGNHDRGHAAALEAANKVARLLWCKGFGYNERPDLSV